jgi:hypothetical protein
MPDSFATYDPATSLWRTSQRSLDGDLAVWAETWPRSGMTRSGSASLLPLLVPPTFGIGCGLLPTPGAHDHKGSAILGQREGQLDEFAENLPDWIRCPCCEDFLCATHWPSHVHECDCPALGEGESGTSPTDPYSEATYGRLSPALSEWLMGYPDGWTALEDSAMPSSRRSRSGSQRVLPSMTHLRGLPFHDDDADV